MADNFDFGSFFNDFISKNSTAADSSYEPSQEDIDSAEDFIGGGKWKMKYDELQSDFDSYRKRVENQKDIERNNLKKELILGFLDFVDYTLHTYRAKSAMNTMTKEDEMILEKLSRFLEKYGVSPMENPVGKPFDVNLHEAIMLDNSGFYEKGTVTMVVSHGYMFGETVLRHAKVVVSG